LKEYKATIREVKGKLYVCMTVPEELRHILTGQIKRSTGTTDRGEAEKRLPELAMQLKQMFRDAKSELDSQSLRNEVIQLARSLKREKEFDLDAAGPEQLTQIHRHLLSSENYDIAHIGKVDVSKIIQGRQRSSSQFPRPDKDTRASSIKSLAFSWAETKDWSRLKGKKAFQTHINTFIELMGNLDVKAINAVTIYDFAELMAEKNASANATIINYVASISNVLSFAVRKGLVESNQAKGLDLRFYGRKAEKRKPFTEEQLKKLFELRLPDDIRMLWSILITTGMRLDEAALLSKSDIKVEKGRRHFDLIEALVKNAGSARKVPVPNAINDMLDDYIQGRAALRLFDFPMNADGKAQNAASKKSMRFIRKVTSDPALVTHSLRHSFKDMCRDAGIPEDLHDFITGHSGGDSASNYGEGHSLASRYHALNSIKHDYLG
jgi:integrase